MSRRIIYAITIFVGLILIVNLVRTLYQTYHSGQRVAILAQEVEELNVEEEQLKQQLKYRQSEEFVEQQARDKLGLIKLGETVIVFDESKNLESRSRNLEDGRDARRSNVQEWVRLFLE